MWKDLAAVVVLTIAITHRFAISSFGISGGCIATSGALEPPFMISYTLGSTLPFLPFSS